MTREEAWRILEGVETHLDTGGKISYQDRIQDALDMAISALKAQDATDTNVGSNGDTICRQDAINALSHMMDTDGFRDGWAVSRANVDCMLRSLPPAQPEIIRCKDCVHGVDYYHEGDCYCSNPKWGLTYFGGSWEFYCADAKPKEGP